MAEQNETPYQFPSDNTKLLIEMYYNPGDLSFVCGANGKLTITTLKSIETDFNDNLDDSNFSEGAGYYLFTATWFEGQYDGEGRCELPPGYELTFIAFRPFAEEEL